MPGKEKYNVNCNAWLAGVPARLAGVVPPLLIHQRVPHAGEGDGGDQHAARHPVLEVQPLADLAPAHREEQRPAAACPGQAALPAGLEDQRRGMGP